MSVKRGDGVGVEYSATHCDFCGKECSGEVAPDGWCMLMKRVDGTGVVELDMCDECYLFLERWTERVGSFWG